MKETEVKSEYVCTVTTSNGVEIELTALYLDGVINSFKVKLYDEDMSAELWLDAEGDETPDTFSELDSFPEYRDTPLDDAWHWFLATGAGLSVAGIRDFRSGGLMTCLMTSRRPTEAFTSSELTQQRSVSCVMSSRFLSASEIRS